MQLREVKMKNNIRPGNINDDLLHKLFTAKGSYSYFKNFSLNHLSCPCLNKKNYEGYNLFIHYTFNGKLH